MSQSILFMCARSAKENLLSTLFNYRYTYVVGPLLNFLAVERENYINIVLAEVSDSTCVTLFSL